MKKVAIITLNGYFNYGNRLQNFALQEIIKQQGYDVETILHHEAPLITNENKMIRNIKRICRLKNINLKELKMKVSNKVSAKKRNFAVQSRIPEFKDFTQKYIKETTEIISSDDIPEGLESKYDYFVVGSDQVWNPNYQSHEKILPAIEYLTFAPKEKRLSYAASFGINKIPSNYIPRVKNGLNGMKSILVREQVGAEIVQELTGRKAHLVLDPTMLLTRERWLSIAEPNKNKPAKEFILTYFLGEMSSKTTDLINSISKKYNFEIIHLENYKDIDQYKANPSNFIDYINSASIFLTDSFHGVVFSIVLETPFIVFKRKEIGPSMYSRIETLLRTFNLESRQLELIREKPSEIMSLDFSEIREILVEERNKSLLLLKQSFI
ncbi:polysaccharide pyruvyl transferase family protein [Sporosarcina sp. P13]|uniref:polysaccharide pyruvyl transferase family protein n=1 Tax=Sporosarcina sp. P13 TaxID=2048263 RepID=UPI00130476DD|nr:polysaccharide pyruvyl transferase family protein [Sporosarcina sp. P13]